MLRMTKVADYGIVLLTHIAGALGEAPHNTRDLAERAQLSTAMVSKILKALTRQGILDSHRGSKGGYALARPAQEISVAAIISALDGPISVTECASEEAVCGCEIETLCPTRDSWQRINNAVRGALEQVKLSELVEPLTSCAANRAVPDFSRTNGFGEKIPSGEAL